MPPPLSDILVPENGYIFRITHRDNLPAVLKDGLRCRSSVKQASDYVEIGNPEIIDRRRTRTVPVPPGGTLSNYVPFYFTPCTPMLYNIVSGYHGLRQRARSEIVVLVCSLDRVEEAGAVVLVADRNAALAAASITEGRSALFTLPWPKWQARDFRRDPNDASTMERYQAEALVHEHLPADAISAIITYDESAQVIAEQAVSTSGQQTPVHIRAGWYP